MNLDQELAKVKFRFTFGPNSVEAPLISRDETARL